MNAYVHETNERSHPHHRRIASAASVTHTYSDDREEADEERLLPRGGIVSRTPSSATAAAVAGSKTSTTELYDDSCFDIENDDNEDALFTFHPVDEPEIEVGVSNIFSPSATSLAAKATVGTSFDDGSVVAAGGAAAPRNDEDRATALSHPRGRKKRARSQQERAPRAPSTGGSPTYISDEEDEEEEGDDDSDYYQRDEASGCAPGQGLLLNSSRSLDEGDENNHDESTTAWLSGSTGPTEAEGGAAPGPVDSSRGVEQNLEYGEDKYDDDDGDDDDEDDFETRKRKEEEEMDEEQLRKKRRIEEEERVARNNLWRQSIKRSMFREPPGAILGKRATM